MSSNITSVWVQLVKTLKYNYEFLLAWTITSLLEALHAAKSNNNTFLGYVKSVKTF